MDPEGAKASVSQPDKFVVSVVYGKINYDDLKSSYERVDEKLQSAEFELIGPCKKIGQQAGKIEFQYVHLKKTATTEEALAEIKKRGLCPAIDKELVSFTQQFPEEQKKFPIVALGSIAKNGHCDNCVAHKHGKDGKRALILARSDSVWLESCRFLAVKR